MKADEVRALLTTEEMEQLTAENGGKQPSKEKSVVFLTLKRRKETSGKGLKARTIRGRGHIVAQSKPKPSRHLVNGKYIDLHKLKENILILKYQRNDTQIANFKPERISKDCKDIIEDIITDKFDKRLFDKLNAADARVVKRMVKTLNLTTNINTENKHDQDFQRQFDILRGELNSGNNNPQIKAQLKKYLVEAMNNGLVPLRECHILLYQLSL